MIYRDVKIYTVIATNILEEPIASMLKVKTHDFHSTLNIEQQAFSRCWYLSTKITQHHIPEEHDLNVHHCKNLIFPK
jgi:hypothetical protein